jgi:hypothetical protein
MQVFKKSCIKLLISIATIIASTSASTGPDPLKEHSADVAVVLKLNSMFATIQYIYIYQVIGNWNACMSLLGAAAFRDSCE